MRNLHPAAMVLSASLALMATSAAAADLVFGRSTPQTVLDPQFTVQPTGTAINDMIFDRLVNFGKDLQLVPALALSWRLLDPLTWQIKLRGGVKFHDGSAFTAKDVAFSFKRSGSMPSSPSPTTQQVADIDKLEIVDDLTLNVKTKAPAPLLMDQIGQVFIVPAALGDRVTTADFNSGKAMIGTGPYTFVSWVPNEQVVAKSNPGYWGGKPEFGNVRMRFITEPSARVSALLTGAVDVIDAVPPTDVARLKAQPGVNVYSIPSVRLLYLTLDLANDNSPQITDTNGKPLDKNPLKDARVRQAMSLMIDRKAITDRIFGGLAAPAGQVAVEGQGGYSPDMKAAAPDVAKAKRLLTEAGYPNGFGLTVACSTDRDVNSPEAAQAVAQMFARGGLKVNGVDCQPYSIFSNNATKGKYSVFFWGRSDSSPDTALNLRNGYMTYDEKASYGAFNRGRYSSPMFDALVKQALQEFDQTKRYYLLKQATDVLIGQDMGAIPLYFLNSIWAARKGYSYEPVMSSNTEIRFVHAN